MRLLLPPFAWFASFAASAACSPWPLQLGPSGCLPPSRPPQLNALLPPLPSPLLLSAPPCRLDFRTRVSPAELSTALREMEALAAGFAGHSRLLCGGACQQQPTAAAAGSFAPAPPAAAAKTAAAALADMEAEGSADTTLALGGRPSAASSSCEWEAAEEGQSDEPMQQCCAASAAALSSWGAAGAAAAAAEEAEAEAEGAAERMAPLRRSSRNRCSVEATRPLRFERGLHGAEQPGW